MGIIHRSDQVKVLIASGLGNSGNSSLQVVTPNLPSYRTLGGEGHPLTLATLAEKHLSAHQVAIVHPIRAYQLLRTAIAAEVNPTDLDGTTRTWMPTIKKILKAAPTLILEENLLSHRTKKLYRVAQSYQRSLRLSHLVDSAEIFWRSLEYDLTPQSLWIYGYFNPEPDELAFIDAIATEETILSLFSPQDQTIGSNIDRITDHLKLQGWQVIDPTIELLPVDPSAIEPVCYHYLDQDGELRGTLTQVKQLLHQGVSTKEIVLVAADDHSWGDRLLDLAAEFQLPVSLPYQIALKETRLGPWFKLLLAVMAQQLPTDLTLQLLTHPLSRSPQQSILSPEQFSSIRQAQPRGLKLWQDILGTTPHLEPLSNLETKTITQWLNQFKQIFELFSLRGNLARWSRESVAYQNLMEGLATLSSYPLGNSSELLTWHQWQELLLSSLQVLQTPAYPGRSLVELHRPEKIIGAQYLYVFVLDAVDGQLPRPVTDDVVLDFYEGTQLKRLGWHWPLAEEEALTERFTFAVLQQMAKMELSFSYSKVAFQGGKYIATAPSPYLTELNLIAQEPPSMALGSKPLARQWYLRQSQGMDDPVLETAIANHRIEVNRYRGNKFDEYDGIVGEPFDYDNHRFSVTQLTQLGQCGFKWFAARLLKLGAIEEEDREINSLTKGNLYHRVAELGIKAYQSDPTLKLDDESLITLWFVQAEQELELGNLTGWHHQRREHIRMLQRVFRDKTFLPTNVKDIATIQVEAKLEGRWHGLNITSRIDRLDLTSAGWSVMDYKSGSSVPDGIKNQAGQTKLDLQLAVYQAIVEQHVGPDLVHKASYYSFAKAQELKSKAAAPEELGAAIELLKSHLNTGCYPVCPDREQKACRYCDFDSLCRKSDRVYSKQIA